MDAKIRRLNAGPGFGDAEIVLSKDGKEDLLLTESVFVSDTGTLSISSGIPGEPGYRAKVYRSIRDAALGNPPIAEYDENF
jgi:hypothetical protein